MIDQIIDFNVIKIYEASYKKRMKSAIEISKKRGVMKDVSNVNNREISIRSQHKCLLYEKSEYYQKKCLNDKEKSKDNE